MSQLVTLERHGEGVALVTMTNPKIHNFGSFEAIGALHEALREAREGGARVSVLASGVEGHWFEHAHLADLSRLFSGQAVEGNPAAWFQALAEITHDQVITLAAISGDCSGGGAELGWACDLRVAEEQALFGQPEVQIGVATGIGGTCRLMRLIGPTATAEMVLDGAPLSARRLYELGGVNRVVPRGDAVAYSLAWAQRLATRPAASLVAQKRMLKSALNHHLDEAMSAEQTLFQAVAGSEAARQGMQRCQARFDAGETLREVYGGPRS